MPGSLPRGLVGVLVALGLLGLGCSGGKKDPPRAAPADAFIEDFCFQVAPPEDVKLALTIEVQGEVMDGKVSWRDGGETRWGRKLKGTYDGRELQAAGGGTEVRLQTVQAGKTLWINDKEVEGAVVNIACSDLTEAGWGR